MAKTKNCNVNFARIKKKETFVADKPVKIQVNDRCKLINYHLILKKYYKSGACDVNTNNVCLEKKSLIFKRIVSINNMTKTIWCTGNDIKVPG